MRGSRVLAFMALAAMAAVVAASAYEWSMGMRFYAVESGSMAPAMSPGDLVIDTPSAPTTSYHVGDVITFHPTPGYTTTHRIVAVDASGFTTKGDANRTADVGTVPSSSIVGRVVCVVPLGGYVAGFLRQPAGIAALLLAAVALYIAWGIVDHRGSATPEPTDDPPPPEWPPTADREWR
jgi:signal peptidase